ncbi:MAG: hypothetical protein K8W52_02195, partial [Deltaproteobacteria bacterium]|nr:hypothetical protein [Deltaproteobacteria bacterium]
DAAARAAVATTTATAAPTPPRAPSARLTVADRALAPGTAPPHRTASAIDLYLAQSQYPPTSQPLDPARNPDLVSWNVRTDEAHAADLDSRVSYTFSGDAYWVIGDRAITTFLKVSRNGAPTDVRVVRGSVTVHAPRGAPLAAELQAPIPLQYTLVDGAWVASFRPADLTTITRSVDLVFEIEFDHGVAHQIARLAAGYTPAAAAPARFTGTYREAIEHGSLVVYAGVEVRDAGWYDVDANLWDAANQGVAWTRFKGDLAKGPQEVRLLFFGKVLLDRHSTAPWHLGELRGYRYDADASPPEQYLDAPTVGFTTQVATLGALSPAEWDSPQRAETLRALAADDAAGQLPPIPEESFDNAVR